MILIQVATNICSPFHIQILDTSTNICLMRQLEFEDLPTQWRNLAQKVSSVHEFSYVSYQHVRIRQAVHTPATDTNRSYSVS